MTRKVNFFMMAVLWTNKIIEGEKTYAQVPAKLKDAVADILRERGREDLIHE